MNNCKTCKHWHNRQRELNYWDGTGLCLCPDMMFTVERGRPLGVIDRENERNRSTVSGNPSHDIEAMSGFHKITNSRYSIATDEDFGCVLHESAEKPKKR